ncbi:hypothetical protein D8M30_17060 [Corynebacterium pseudodiphtheriticum]|nr:hypothetical protein D8M30_17060 [Corynebacterium pseudodiphtheriticum]
MKDNTSIFRRGEEEAEEQVVQRARMALMELMEIAALFLLREQILLEHSYRSIIRPMVDLGAGAEEKVKLLVIQQVSVVLAERLLETIVV